MFINSFIIFFLLIHVVHTQHTKHIIRHVIHVFFFVNMNENEQRMNVSIRPSHPAYSCACHTATSWASFQSYICLQASGAHPRSLALPTATYFGNTSTLLNKTTLLMPNQQLNTYCCCYVIALLLCIGF